ncbi:hypothetical protein J7I98_37320 [Streptomyces sp. ISL-98]|uniref:hypothetical protein n=1 Tax=Streptomyces sp. ISL-98 TaxID=2819192 RepID=UPI001BE7B669|nr:hypothetical protein [Streptomyces sp. ISL-98]MBT2511377.1 hypothetical protein [Streptomyces sp. ISL-98]
MSIQLREPGGIPAETVRVARAMFPKESLAIRVRDELGLKSPFREGFGNDQRERHFTQEWYPACGVPVLPCGPSALLFNRRRGPATPRPCHRVAGLSRPAVADDALCRLSSARRGSDAQEFLDCGPGDDVGVVHVEADCNRAGEKAVGTIALAVQAHGWQLGIRSGCLPDVLLRAPQQ